MDLLIPGITRIARYFPKIICMPKNSTREHSGKLMEGPTHQKWNHSKIINILHTINQSMQKINITKIISTDNA
jgi:hypothetical protein